MENSSYISSLSFLQHSFVQGREILSSVLDVQNEEEGFLDVMQALGKLKPTSQPVYHAFVNEALYKDNAITISEAGSGTAKQSGISTSARGNARVGDLMMGVSGNVYLLTAIAANGDIDFVPVDGAGVATDYDASGDKFVVFSNAQGEGSGSPDPIKYGLTKQSNRVQIFKNKYRISDVAKASKITVEYKGKPYFMYKGTYEALQRFRGDISNALMFGAGSGDFYAGASVGDMSIGGNAVQTTNGLKQELKAGGILNSGSPYDHGTDVLATLSTLTAALNKARAPKDYWMWLGTSANIAIDNALNGLTSAGLTGARFAVDGKNIDLGVDKFSLYGRSWNKKQLSILDHNELGSTVTGSGEIYLVPTGQVKTAGGGGSQDYLQVRYLEGDGNNFSFRETLTGGLAPTPTSADSILDVNYQAIMGLEVLGKEHCALVTGF